MSEQDERSQHDREFGDEERFVWRERERMGAQWDDRSSRWDDREDRKRSTEYYGQGQSGYAAGRYESDRSYGSPTQMNPNWNERYPDRGGDERFTGGRGGSAWRRDDRSMHHQQPGGYGQRREGYGDQASYGSAGNMGTVSYGSGGHYGDPGNARQGYDQGGYLGQGGQQMGYIERGDRDRGDMGHGAQGITGQHGWIERGTNMTPGHRGKGPSGYTRSDDRIREIVCEVLTDDDHIDATNIEVSVKNGEVTLSGAVEDRAQKRMAEDRIEYLSGVKDVINQLRVASRDRSRTSSGTSISSSIRDDGHGEPQSSSDKRNRA